MITLIPRLLRARSLEASLADEQQFYGRVWTTETMRAWQLDQFNSEWSAIRSHVPYYAELSAKAHLPEKFASWTEFSTLLPRMDRKTVQSQRQRLTDPRGRVGFYRYSGASTAEPVQLPAWNSELMFANRDLWYGRSWHGVRPSDKLFLIWGGSHRMLGGISRWFHIGWRTLKDWLAGYERVTALDLSDARLREAGRALLARRPVYMMAFSGALLRFAYTNYDRKRDFHRLNLKVAIASAEAFPRNDSAEIISGVLGCPVIMEYGSAETGALAYQDRAGVFQIFWRHYVVEWCASATTPGAGELLITSLYPRCFPLIRYEIGDLAEPADEPSSILYRMRRVIGKRSDYIELSNGSHINPQVFIDAIDRFRSITDFQVVNRHLAKSSSSSLLPQT